MRLSVGLKVTNGLSLTPQLQQAIRLLQLSSLELEQEIQAQLESNPLLEKVEETSIVESLSELNIKESEDLTTELNADYLPDDLPIDTHWDDVYTHQPTTLATAEYEEREDSYHRHLNLKDHILEQINLLHFSQIDQLIAYCIVDALDDKGFLDVELDELVQAINQLLPDVIGIDEYEVELSEVIVVLKHIQRLDPLGVASRGVAEYLQLQLETLNENVPFLAEAKQIIKYEQLLVTHDLSRLLKQTHLSKEQIKGALNVLKTLRQYPDITFSVQDSEYQIPDVVVFKKDQQWKIQLNPDVLPKLRINPFYSNMIRRADQGDDNTYLRNQMLEAKSFIKSIDERHKTLLKVTSCIVKHQRAFLEQGPEAMKPLVLRDVAEEVELHESTISRVTTNKYMLTPRGLFELKYFFSSHVGTTTGGEASSTAIRAMIKKLVAHENTRKPLSDSAITELLKNEGINVARRTVAKYRESLHIPSSSDRKVLI